MTTKTEAKPMTARAQLREWIADQIRGKDEIDLPKLRDLAIAHFSNNRKFIQALMQEAMSDLVYEVAQKVVAQTREGPVARLGDTLATRDGVARIAKRSRFSNWMEHAGEGFYRLDKMKKSQLEEAAGEREVRGKRELRIAEFLRMLAKRLDDEQAVDDVFTDEELEQIWAELDETD